MHLDSCHIVAACNRISRFLGSIALCMFCKNTHTTYLLPCKVVVDRGVCVAYNVLLAFVHVSKKFIGSL